jgi:outer membrane lipoprotein-sorting protein
MTLATSRGGGQALVRRVQVTRKQSVRPGKALVRFLEPPTLRRTSVLVLENEGAYDDFWVYLPALKRTRRIGGAQRGDSFFGTDLSYEDVEPKHAEDWEVRVVGQDAVGSQRCVVLELVPREGVESAYEKLVSCIDPAFATILRTEFYVRGERTKLLAANPDSVRAIAGRFIPFELTMTTPKRRTETRVETELYEIRDDVPDDLFTTWNLESGNADRDRAVAEEPGD